MNDKWFSITAAAEPAAPVEVFIYSEIGDFGWGDGTSARNFIAALQEHRNRKVVLRMNSPGGVVTDGLAIYNYLKGRGNVDVIVDGYVASIATIIALAGDTLTIARNGLFMVHNVSGGVWGNENDVRQYADVLAKFNGQLVATYADETGQPEDRIRAWMDAETWFTAAEAVQHGFATALGDEVSLVAHAGLSRFKNVPTAIRPVDFQAQVTMKPEDISSAVEKGNESLLAKIMAALNGDASLKASVTDLTNQLTAAQVALATETAQVAKLTADLATATAAHQAEVAKLTAEHATALEQARQTAGAAALAKTGVVAVPAASTDSTQGAETIETIRAQINAEKDPAKRYILAQKARELRGHADLFKRN